MSEKRIVITGMGIVSPIGDTLQDFYLNLLNGKSGIRRLQGIDTSKIDSKIGGDLSSYNYKDKLKSYMDAMPEEYYRRIKKLIKHAPFSTKLTLIAAIDAFIDARLFETEFDRTASCLMLGGHNFHNHYIEKNVNQFLEEPDYIDGLFGVNMFDIDTAACIAESLQIYGPMNTVGAACASAGIALRNAIDEIKYHDAKLGMVGGGVLEYSPVGYHSLAMMQAVSYRSYNEEPEKASRPFDMKREGFVPSHGSGMLMIEELEHARNRGVPIYAEILGVESSNDASHLTRPSVGGQSYVIKKVLNNSGIQPQQVDYVNTHATSTPVGDKIEAQTISEVFGKHVNNLKVNATKSLIGHTGWTAHSVEMIASVLQMNNSKLHPSINIEEPDPVINFDICANESVDHKINYFINNSFGFGGVNCCSLVTSYDE